jgi:DNA-directed RNA polymerase specialized sigma24 family protein
VVEPITFTEFEMRKATSVARRIHRIQRNLIEFDDIRSECYLWMCSHPQKVLKWRTEGRKGKGSLDTALYRAGMKWATRERARISETEPADHAFYSTGLLEEVLPDVFDYESWVLDSHADDSQGRSVSRPGEHGTRLAVLVDVSDAVGRLSEDDRMLLKERYADGGMSVQALAASYDTSESTMRRRIKNLLIKLADKLGGEPPWV